MTRDEIIISFIPVIKRVVKKYNNGMCDEDLESIAMIKAIKAVDKSLEEGLSYDNILGRVIVWSKNAILDELRRPDYYQHQDELIEEKMDDVEDIDYMILKSDTENSLSGNAKEIFALLLKGYSDDEIEKELNIAHVTLMKNKQKIKNSIIKNRG